MSLNLPAMVISFYLCGLSLLIILEKAGRKQNTAKIRLRKQYLFNQPVAFEEQRYAFLFFFFSFALAWNLIYFKIVPAIATYDTVFGPVMVIGCWWFLHLFFNTHKNLGWEKSRKLLVTFIILWALANFVDLGLIKLGAWNFSNNTTLGIIPFPYFLQKDVFGNLIQVPYVEVLGFNLFIGWFILFVQMFINDLIKSPSSIKKLFEFRKHKTLPLEDNEPLLEPFDFTGSIKKAVEKNDMMALEEFLAKLFRSLAMGFKLNEAMAGGILNALRKKRLFFQMQRACEVFFKYDFAYPVVLRQMAQSLIDQGSPHSAPFYLNQIDLSPLQDTKEWRESKGLMGRTYKQCYVDLQEKSQHAEQYLLAALEQYRDVYLKDKAEYWHGINYVACTARGQRDQLQDKAFGLDWKKTAQEIYTSLAGKSQNSEDKAWALATVLESCIALDKTAEAMHWAERYVNCQDAGADVFEFSSTYRQLTEVWQLDLNPKYSGVLNLLRKVILSKPTGKILWRKEDLQNSSGEIWLGKLTDASKGSARVENKAGTPVGSGFLIPGKSLDEKWNKHGLVFITAAHVLGGSSAALPWAEARLALFSNSSRVQSLERIWISEDLDIAIFSLLDLPPEFFADFSLKACEDWGALESLIPNQSRLYILGYPLGGPLQINCANNHFVGCTSTYLRYKTQTWPGSSGSPILDENWQVVGVHTEASLGEDTNQGVNWLALVAAVKKGPNI